jgi:hypothetical protein
MADRAIDDGGYAYPFKLEHEFDKESGVPTRTEVFPGMSLRDHFAGLALPVASRQYSVDSAKYHHHVASECYAQADAMIAARKVTA